MRLKKLKVAGFKSFVDPTTITVPSNLVGIVGPNGCGKSNVIDAVRWVMGESSAKTLRGDQMVDVIFNGSTTRKPVGKASVELVFENDDGKVPDSFANFSEISIRRTLTRDGKSDYFINNTRARRRDIQDIFRGTGLGPRSYSIIEQGMVSRIIESKPEDLRAFVEEAAGISRYKDRRRETENRIRHTRENLERVVDIVRELETQLRRLQRQSQAARRYRALKEEEHLLHGQLLWMRQRALEEADGQQRRNLAEMENALQQTIAGQRSTEQHVEALRVEAGERREDFDRIQGRYYAIGAKISNIEQRIEHESETRRRREQDLDRLNASVAQLESERDKDQSLLAGVREQLATLQARRETLATALDEAANRLCAEESAFGEFQNAWDSFNTEALTPQRELEVQKSVIGEQTSVRASLGQRLDRLERECKDLVEQLQEAEPAELREEVRAHRSVVEQTATGLAEAEKRIVDIRADLDSVLDEHTGLGQSRHSDAARLHSLKEIQASALGEDDEEYRAWIKGHGLCEANQLIASIQVSEGWQQAADAVLGPFLTAIVTEGPAAGPHLENATSIDFTLVESGQMSDSGDDPTLLIHHVGSDSADLHRLIGGVRVADSLDGAMAQRARLGAGQSVVTRDGILVGPNWIRLPGSKSRKLGILARGEEIRGLERRIADADSRLETLASQIDTLRAGLREQEQLRNHCSQSLTRCNREHADLQNRLGQREARHSQLRQRLQRFDTDREELTVQIANCEQRIANARDLSSRAELSVERYEQERDQWRTRREGVAGAVDAARVGHQQSRDAKYEVDTRWQLENSRLRSLEEGLKRTETRRHEMLEQTTALGQALSGAGRPEEALREQLGELLITRERVESELNVSRQESERVELAIQEGRQRVLGIEREVEQHREALGRQRLVSRETELKLQALAEQIEVGRHDLVQLADGMPQEAEDEQWRLRIEDIAAKIDRIGPVNLIAIEEYEEQSERKTYLDAQHADLTSALDTLESVIRKIDRETRARFKETFDKLNEGFRLFFPQLFGGGSASLELTDNDLLTTGVTVMARPPGKRNSTIHLLSGGEKALTAVSLLFSLFQLNPAPFCLLDEVDAPLDDANVERYCRTLRSLSDKSQLLVITHNKITMEATDVLIGVTMSEPGVSRVVSVDIGQAVRMAAS